MDALGSRTSEEVVVMRNAEVLVGWVAEKGGGNRRETTGARAGKKSMLSLWKRRQA